MLHISGLSKKYASLDVCKDINIELHPEKIVGLFGANGAGKSTCFHMITGLITPSKGKIFINGEEVTYEPIHKRAQKGLSFLPQESSIFKGMTVGENIYSVLELNKSLNKQQRLTRFQTLIERFQLEKVVDSTGGVVSGGERRRTEIARAIANSPKYILLDEPFAGIDPLSIKEIQKLITHIRDVDKVGVLITDHNVKETLPICDYAYVLHKGEILAHNTPEKIIYDENVCKYYLGEKAEQE